MSNFMTHLNNIYQLGLKELKSLWSDKVMLLLIVYAFTANIYSSAKGVSQELHNAPVAIVDQDHSQLSMRLANSLTKPYFKTPDLVEPDEATKSLDRGYHSFSIIIPPSFQKDLIAGRKPTVQLNIDATVMSQAFIGSGYIETIFNNEINEYLNRTAEPATSQPINLVTHVRFNPNMTGFWFGGVIQVINNVTMLTIILVGAAYIREREQGPLDHGGAGRHGGCGKAVVSGGDELYINKKMRKWAATSSFFVYLRDEVRICARRDHTVHI